MIKVSDAAAKQIKISLDQMGDVEVPLRIAIKVREDGSFHYNMGFDSTVNEDDKTFDEKRITFVVDATSMPLIGGMEIDFVEIEGKQEIVFLNPNDPHFKPPIK
ncbi:MAG: iron-sulfur cluster assembly protein [Cocleimonas sp.]|jgi:iron-sulfur cluster assembly protein